MKIPTISADQAVKDLSDILTGKKTVREVNMRGGVTRDEQVAKAIQPEQSGLKDKASKPIWPPLKIG